MSGVDDFIRWVSENESFLSGMAAMAALAGVLVSGLAVGTRRLLRKPSSASAPREDAAPTVAPEATPVAAPDPSDPVLAVLAFDNLSNDSEMDFFSDGVSEEIIQRLSRGATLKVIGRTTSFQFRGERKALAAEQLRCTHVLDGSIRRAAGQVRISAHLVESASSTTLWSERYDRGLEDVFRVQDEISESIASALDRAFSPSVTEDVDSEIYDLYLRARPESYAPDDLRRCIALLEDVTRRAPDYADAWGRLAFLRAWFHFYEPFAERPAAAAQVRHAAERALSIDGRNVDAMGGELFVAPPFGAFIEGDRVLESLRSAPAADHKGHYIGWYLRTTGRIRESLEVTERAHRLDSLDMMATNMLALARMAAGRVDQAIPIFEDVVERSPEMSFPVANLLRAHAFREDWEAVDRVLALAEKRDLREFSDGLPFIQAKRHPTPENLGHWLRDVEDQLARTGGVDVSKLVYAAHFGFVDESYRLAEGAILGPTGADSDLMGPDGYRTALLFQAGMPELRNDERFPGLCARLGLVEFWLATAKWPDCASEVPYDFESACATVRDTPVDDFFPPAI